MKYSQLVPFLTILLSGFGEVGDSRTHLQEDCAGAGVLSCAASHFDLRATKRDVPLTKIVLYFFVGHVCYLSLTTVQRLADKCTLT